MIGENCLVCNWKTTKRFFSLTVSTYKTYFFEWNHWLSFTTNLERQITVFSRSKNTYNLFMWLVKKKNKTCPLPWSSFSLSLFTTEIFFLLFRDRGQQDHLTITKTTKFYQLKLTTSQEIRKKKFLVQILRVPTRNNIHLIVWFF